jgi:hypothetical protein
MPRPPHVGAFAHGKMGAEVDVPGVSRGVPFICTVQ